MNYFSFPKIFGFLLLICLSTPVFSAEMLEPASIKGCVIEKSSGNPLEFATVIVKNKKDSIITQSVTDKNGWFVFKGIPMGEYRISYSFIGFEKIDSVPVAIKTINQKINLGKLYITEAGQMLNQVEVVGQRSTFVNSIDRKTFNVGQDLMSKSGSVSDLMQNIPSVQVDMDGNVSLRGSENVTILIDGKPSAMMKINRAAVLQQMSAGNVEKIEIITNPSAKYKPDGTSGIINIVMKKDRNLGFNGNVTANVGNEGRWNINGMLSYNPGKLNLYGSLGVRQDNRTRINDVTTNNYDSVSGKFLSYSRTYSKGTSRPISYIGNLGFDYKLNDMNKIGASVSYNYRTYLLNDTTNYVVKDNLLNTTLSYDRPRYRPEWESDLEFKAFYNHKFNKEGHELNFDLTNSVTNESEDTHFTNFYYIPALATTKEHTLYTHLCYDTEFSAEYSLPLGEDRKFEAGYIFQNVSNDLNLIRDTTRTVNPDSWFNDLQRSNRFIRSESTNVLYATYEQEIGKFGFLVGLRAEHTTTRANLVTLDSIINNNYFRLYPTIHASYKLGKMHELQLNYSHRIRRPEDEELNPFPEYQDMRNIRAGNPLLLPEDTHSFEFGYQYKNDATTFLSTLYYRNSYNLVTNIIQDLGNAVYKTTLENLSQSQAAGLELILSSGIAKFMTFNIATNAFYNTIDASSLGYSSNKSNIAWSANANVNFNLTKSTVWQFTSNYTAETLTPQGKRVPSFVLNSGLKQDLFKKKGALILTVSDIFNSMRYQTEIDIPTMKRIEIRRRSSQTIYLGFTYNFGGSDKKQKDNMKFDNAL